MGARPARSLNPRAAQAARKAERPREQREVRRSIIALAPLSNLNSSKRAIRA
jgi:hypothetical protein